MTEEHRKSIKNISQKSVDISSPYRGRQKSTQFARTGDSSNW